MSKGIVNNFNDELVDLSQQFFLVADRYKSALTEYYLANSPENKSNIDNAKQLITKIYSNVFMTSSKLHDSILENNKQIQSLDEYLDKLKKNATKENKTLQNVNNSGKGAIPRKQYLRKTMQQDYYKDVFYSR
jgi:uncharacterized phage infection (PIP) family protein YhgE